MIGTGARCNASWNKHSLCVNHIGLKQLVLKMATDWLKFLHLIFFNIVLPAENLLSC